MAKSSETPTIEFSSDSEEIHRHPAYGMVSMSVVHGGSTVLFGSDIEHSDRVRISVHPATKYRSLNRDMYMPSVHTLIDFEMSQAQFAEFITSGGRSGT